MARPGGRLAWLIAFTAAAVPATAAAQLPAGYTIQSFGDEFDGTALDTATWNAGVINYPSGSTWLWRNHPGNNAVSGGYLVQTTLYQDVTGDGVPEWTCSSVSARSFSQRFGYWESRIRITDFDYTDNAWWSSDIGTGHLSGMDGFEIDAPEAWSPNKYTASIYDHAVQDGSTPTSIHFVQNLAGKNFTTAFSVFGWDWGTDNTVKCYADGTLVHTFSAAAMNGIEALVPQGPIQGTALWTTGLTPSNSVANGDSKYVDYVRIYQKPGWTGTTGLKRWGDAANWGPDGVPASGRAAVFNTAAASGTITLAADQPVQEVVFQGGATGATTIAGPGRLLLGMTTAVTATTGAIGGINLVNDTRASVTVAADMVAQRKVQFSNFAGASITTGPTPGVELVLAGDLTATTAGTPVNFLTTAPIVVTGSIDGGIGRITKGGQGIVRLNAANAFAGGLEIRDGIVEVNADGALGAVAGGVTMEPGSAYDKPSLVLNGVAYSDPVPLAIRGTGSRSTGFPQSAGAVDASGTARFAGPITALDDATIAVQRGGQLTLSGTLDTRDHVLTLGSIGTLTVSGRITGSSAGQIDKYNTGSTSLTGDNSGFLGSVKVRMGTLVVNGDAALGGGTGDVVRLEGGTLRTTADFTSGKGGSFAATAGNAIDTNGRSIAFNGSFAGPGGFTKLGAGTLTLGGSSAFQGPVRIVGGTVSVSADSRLGITTGGLELDGGTLQGTAGMTLAAGRTLTIGPRGGTLDHTAGSNLFVAGSIAGPNAPLSIRTASPILGAVFLDGAVSLGRLTLSCTTTGVGLRSIAVVDEAIRVGPRQILHLNGLNSTGTAAATYAGFDVALEGGTLRNRFGGNTVRRSVTVSADSTVENRVGNGNSLSFAAGTLALGTSSLTVRAGPAAGEWVAIGGGLQGGAESELALAGGGQLRLSGSNPAFSGRITIIDGAVRIDSEVALDDRVTVGFSGTSPAKTLAIAAASVRLGRLDLVDDARIEIGTGLVTVATGLSGERLRRALVAGRGNGQWDARTGITSAAVAVAAAAGASRSIGWADRGDGSMSFAFAAPGDANIDGIVDVLDAADLIAAGRFDTGADATWAEGDFGYDGVVDVLDVADFLSGGLFDAGPQGGDPWTGGPAAAVPEPVFSQWIAPLLAVSLALRSPRRK